MHLQTLDTESDVLNAMIVVYVHDRVALCSGKDGQLLIWLSGKHLLVD